MLLAVAPSTSLTTWGRGQIGRRTRKSAPQTKSYSSVGWEIDLKELKNRDLGAMSGDCEYTTPGSLERTCRPVPLQGSFDASHVHLDAILSGHGRIIRIILFAAYNQVNMAEPIDHLAAKIVRESRQFYQA